MDFVQRNLINERNNLQVELAKAKIRIAQLSEMRVVDSMKSGGVGSAINAVKSNIKQRGILGGLGINPKKGFVNKLGVPLVKGDDGNLIEPILGTVDKSSKGRAANRVIIGAAESQIMSQASFGPANIQKVKRGETMVKKPINPHYGIEGTAQYEQTEYISDLENAVIALAESMNMSVEDLMEYQVSDKNRNTPKGEALAKRYAVRLRKLAAARNDKLVSDSDALGAERGNMAQGVLDARMGDRLNKALTAAGVKTHFNAEPYTPGYIKRDGEYSAIAKDTPLNISKVPEADRVMAHKEMTAMGNADRTGRRAEAASVAAAIARKRAHKENEDKWTV